MHVAACRSQPHRGKRELWVGSVPEHVTFSWSVHVQEVLSAVDESAGVSDGSYSSRLHPKRSAAIQKLV